MGLFQTGSAWFERMLIGRQVWPGSDATPVAYASSRDDAWKLAASPLPPVGRGPAVNGKVGCFVVMLRLSTMLVDLVCQTRARITCERPG